MCAREIADIFPCLEKKNPTLISIAFSLDTVELEARSFKLCMFITLLGVYIFKTDLMTVILFQGHRCVRNINCELCFLDSCPQ